MHEDTTASVSGLQALQGKIRSGYLWNAGAVFTKQVFGLAISVALARLLSPEDFGLMGLTAIFVEIFFAFQDLGIGRTVVYYKDNESEYPTYFTASAVLGLLITLVLMAAAPAISHFYEEPRLTPLLRVASLAVLVGGLRSVPQAILTKHLDFKGLNIFDMISTLAGALCALVLALIGMGVWSLVANLIVTIAVSTAFFVWAAPLRFTFRFEPRALSRVRTYGLRLSASNLMWQIYDQADFMVIGKVLGPVPLGIYTLAFRIATLLNQKLGSIVTSVSFPAFSAMESDRERVIGHWFGLTRRLALVCFPVLGALAVNADDLIPFVYGEKWRAAALPLQFLCVVGALRTLAPMTLALTAAQGRADINMKYGFTNFVLMPVAFLAGCKLWGLMGVGLAWAAIFPISCTYLFISASRHMQIPVTNFFTNLRVPVTAAVGSMAVMLLARTLLAPGFLRLSVSSALGAITATAILWRSETLRTDILPVLRRLRPGI